MARFIALFVVTAVVLAGLKLGSGGGDVSLKLGPKHTDVALKLGPKHANEAVALKMGPKHPPVG